MFSALFLQPGKSLAADSKANSTLARLENVVIVYKTHFDLGYTARVRDVVHEYRTEMADRVLDAIEQNRKQPKDRQFIWTLSGWPMQQILWDGQPPERRQKIERAIRDGNLAVHAYPFTTHTETAELEDLVRGLNISSRINRRFGRPLSTSAKMSDVPGQSWIFPTLFAHAGIKFYHMGGPLVNRTLGLPPFFWWEGPDGSRLLTLYNNGYGSATLPPADWPYKTWIYIRQPFGEAWNDLWARGLPPQYELMAASWRDHADYIDQVERLVTAPFADAVATLADNVSLGGGRIVVFNPLPWQRDGEVTLNAFHLAHGDSLKPAEGGPAISYFGEGPALEDSYRVIRFIARDVPPLGYRTYVISNEKTGPDGLIADETNGVIESAFFQATFDPKRGRIASLMDKRTGRELVDTTAPQAFGQYFYERFARSDLVAWTEASLYPEYGAHKFLFSAYDMPTNSAYTSAVPESMSLTIRKTSIDVSAVMTGTIAGAGPPQQIFIRLTLPATLPVADLEVGWDKPPDGWPEAAWLALPFNIANPKFRLGRLGTDLDPVRDVSVDHANCHNSWVNTGVAVYDEKTGAGVGVCPRDTPLVSLGEPGEYQFQKRYEPKRPRVFLNLYNNHWRTNFRSWIGDGRRMTARARLWAFDKFHAESALYTPAMETRVPLAAARTTARPGKLPLMQSGILLSRKGVAVTAFGPNPDGAGTVLRLWEQVGISGELGVTIPSTFKTATPVSLRGEMTGESFPVRDGKFSFGLRAFAPASFRLGAP